MKYFALLVIGIFALGAAYLFLFTNSDTVTNYPSDGTTVVAFGDSLVEGVGATDGNDFVSVLSRQVGEPIVNLGVRGDTTADALLRLDQVLAQDPKVVMVLLGGNDYLQQIPKTETFANLKQIVTTIHDSGAVVILLGVRGGLLRDGYQGDYEDVAQSLGTAYVPNVLDGLFGNPSYMSDSVHPNDAGYQIIADKVEPVLRDLVQ
jgi:lysophospholipase L1-like esterase